MAEMMEMMTEMQDTIQSLKRKIHKQNKKIKTMFINTDVKPVNTHIRYEYLDDACDWNSRGWGNDDDNEKDPIEEVEPVKKEKSDDNVAPIQVIIEEVPKVVVKMTEPAVAELIESIQSAESKVVEPVKSDDPDVKEKVVQEEKMEELHQELHQEEELEKIEIDGKDYYVDDDNVIYKVSDPSIRAGVLDENDEPIFDTATEPNSVKVTEAIKEEVVEDIIKEEVAAVQEEEEEELDEIEIDGQDYYIDGDNVIYGMNEQRDPGDRVGVLDENDEPIFDKP